MQEGLIGSGVRFEEGGDPLASICQTPAGEWSCSMAWDVRDQEIVTILFGEMTYCGD